MIKKLLLASVLFTLSTSGAFAFQEEYFVTGTNLNTGERVIGWLDGTLGESEVQGLILDRGRDDDCRFDNAGGRGLKITVQKLTTPDLARLACQYTTHSHDVEEK